jgi:hypothetical protein
MKTERDLGRRRNSPLSEEDHRRGDGHNRPRHIQQAPRHQLRDAFGIACELGSQCFDGDVAAKGIVSPDYPITAHAVAGYSGGGKSMIADYEAVDPPDDPPDIPDPEWLLVMLPATLAVGNTPAPATARASLACRIRERACCRPRFDWIACWIRESNSGSWKVFHQSVIWIASAVVILGFPYPFVLN